MRCLVLLFLIAYAFGQCFDPKCNNCSSAPTTCASCSSQSDLDFQGYCTACVDGFYFNTTTKMCNTCSGAHCILCDTNNTCMNCDDYYGLMGANCAACPDHANACYYNQQTNRMEALSCDPGYYVSGAVCVGCPALQNCQYCENANTCAFCKTGYGYNETSNNCEPCAVSNCNVCTSVDKCDSCASGYARTTGGFQCVGNQCTSSLCQAFGQYLNPARDGTTCGGGCSAATCCLGVQPGWIGFYLYQKVGSTNCGSLRSLEALTPDTCGYSRTYSDYYNAHCTDSNSTIQLQTYLDSGCETSFSNPVDVPTDNCTTMSSLGGNRYGIFSCPNHRCSSSIYCLQCTNNTCGLCSTGYYPSGNTCNQCDAHCDECLGTNNCTDCESGYYLDSSLTCTACSTLPNCASCQSPTTCRVCNDGYYPDANGACVACQAHCDVCILGAICVNCADGYSYNTFNNSCVALVPHATSQTYTISGSVVVGSCVSGYYVSADASQCLACPGGCATCSIRSGGVYCSACPQGQGFINAPQQCSACSSSFHCRECLSYAYDNKDGCISCPSGYYIGTDHKCHSFSHAAGLTPTVGVALLLALLALISA